jgi:hypothetical protein
MPAKQTTLQKIGVYILKLVCIGVFLWLILHFGATWDRYLTGGALLALLIMGLAALHPKMAADLVDALSDRLRGFDEHQPKPPSPGTPP